MRDDIELYFSRQFAGHDGRQRLQCDSAWGRVVDVPRWHLRGTVGGGYGFWIDFIRSQGAVVLAGYEAAVGVPQFHSSACAKRLHFGCDVGNRSYYFLRTSKSRRANVNDRTLCRHVGRWRFCIRNHSGCSHWLYGTDFSWVGNLHREKRRLCLFADRSFGRCLCLCPSAWRLCLFVRVRKADDCTPRNREGGTARFPDEAPEPFRLQRKPGSCLEPAGWQRREMCGSFVRPRRLQEGERPTRSSRGR